MLQRRAALPAYRAALSLLALVWVLIALDYAATQLTRPVDDWVNDRLLARHAQQRPAATDIVIVNIDQASLTAMRDEAGSWPWPRAIHAELLDGLARQQPRAIVFDLMFNEPDTFRPDSDQLWQASVSAHRDLLYLPSVQLADGIGPKLRDLPASLGLQRGPQADANASLPLLLPTVLAQSDWRGGLINFMADYDGIGRQYLVRRDVAGWTLPSLPVQLAQDQHWPIPDASRFTLNWTQPHTRISYADLYADFNREHPQRPADEFRDKIVLIGTAAPGLQDLRPTPLSGSFPGIEILATAMDNLQHGDWLRSAPRWQAGVWALLLCTGLLTALACGLNALWLGLALLLLTLASVALGWLALGQRWLLPLYGPLVWAWLTYLAGAVQAWLAEKRRRLQAVAMFGRFVDPRVARQLVETGQLDRSAQARTRQISVLFSDIRGFTTLSETRPPEYIVDLLNRYFTRQVDVVFRHGGTLDKFIGDCIMAFWGAPTDDAAHAQHAVAAALEMAQVLQDFRAELTDLHAEFDVGIGVHSGPAVVGLIGSPARLDYTAIGDTVNLASRIEGATKGVARILVSQATRDACGDTFGFTDHGMHAVKGREQGVRLFEPHAPATSDSRGNTP